MSKVKFKKSNKNNDLVKDAITQKEFDMFMNWVANQVQDQLEHNFDTMISDMERAIIQEETDSNLFNKNK